MSTKEKQTWALFAGFIPCSFENNEREHVLTKNQNPTKRPQSQSLRCQISLRIKMRMFPLQCKPRKLLPETWNIDKKVIPTTEATVFIKTMDWNRNCSQVPSFLFQQISSTMSKTYMHLEKIKFFFSLRRQETFCRLVHSHQGAYASTSSSNIFQSTVIVINEVESQDTVNTILGNGLIGFQK